MRAGFGDDIDDAAEGAAVFGAEAVVDDAEFAYGFLRRGGALRAGGGVDVVGAVDGDFIAEVAHAGKRDAGDFEFGDGGLQAGAARGYAWGEQGEIGEEAAADGQRVDLLGVDHLADFCARGFDYRRFARDDYLLALGGDFQGDVDGGALADGQDEAGLRVIREAGEGDL